ncbi:UDP-N-acetylmuramoyl-tripeptide--D-alanyl-D-alanine ligase [Lacinutrix neustonica]|uniref:UDP-N-acetylmuramoyl-tripeptide--D-alanyl-D-alanine ligase n=1 Tax=Lacinutrix neustonica TaxID=2980107 RepID=A0A9E8MYN0_9FLAO|nr:UDP-N-acetylmuramoyl-tripeptide--D-alanyl-D-alanine ligase [Lacinutrix neustonica]WAC03436.1 UDP-N-acetylmuramoyl-tripeptide--D-alanyl-D-alanine ligase [Lacinutrix neustonica]
MKIKDLHALLLNFPKVCTDTRKLAKNDIFFALKGENYNGNAFAKQAVTDGAKYAVIDEAEYQTSEQYLLVENVLETLQALATYHRTYLNVPIIALTGSNGKTTTKELINATLSQHYKTTATVGNLNNHIGVALTLLSMTKQTEIGIVEMGANHLREIAFLCAIAKPDYGYITNFGKAHLEGFGGVEGVIKGKTELYNYLKKNDKLIFVNGNDPKQQTLSQGGNVYSFGKTNDSEVIIQFIEAQPFVTCEFDGHRIQTHLIGEYNFSNISSAICIANYFEVSAENIKKGLESYTPKNNRSQIIKKAGVKIILDAYNANPTSMTAALTNFDQLKDHYKIAILGDMFELGNEAKTEHQSITNLASDLNIDEIILVGENFYKTESVSQKTTKFKSFEALKQDFKIPSNKKTTLLIKGSRGMALERLLDVL